MKTPVDEEFLKYLEKPRSEQQSKSLKSSFLPIFKLNLKKMPKCTKLLPFNLLFVLTSNWVGVLNEMVSDCIL